MGLFDYHAPSTGKAKDRPKTKPETAHQIHRRGHLLSVIQQRKKAEAEAKKEQKRQAQIEKLRKQSELHEAYSERAEAVARRRKAQHRAGQLHPISMILGGRALERKPSGRKHKGTWYRDI